MAENTTQPGPENQGFIRTALGRIGQRGRQRLADALAEARTAGYLEATADFRSPEDEPVSGTTITQGYRSAMGSVRGPGDLAYDEIHSVVWQVFLRHPVAKRLSQIKRDHILGRGCKPIAEGDEDLQSILDKFWVKNQLNNRLRKFVHQLFLFGEQIFPVFVRKTDGRVQLGYIDPADLDENGVILHPENALIKHAVVLKEQAADDTRPWVPEHRKRRVYRIIRPCDLPKGEEDKLLTHTQVEKEPWEKTLLTHFGLTEYTGDVLYWSVNDVANQARGLSDYHQLIPWLMYYEDVLSDLASRENTASLYAWDLEMEGASQEQCDARAIKLARNPPQRNSFLVHNEKETWKFQVPGLEQTGSIAVLGALLNNTTGGAGIPGAWFGEGGDENRATAREQNRPTWKTLQHDQDELKDDILQMLNFVRDQAEMAGEWKKREVEDEPQELVVDDPMAPLPEIEEISTVEPGTITLEMAEVSTLDVQAIAVALERLIVALGSAIEKGLLTERRASLIWSRVLREIGSDYDAEKEFAAAQAEKKQKELAMMMQMDLAQGPEEEEPGPFRSDRQRPDQEPEPEEGGGTKQVVGARGEEAWWTDRKYDAMSWSPMHTSGDIHSPIETSARCPICDNNYAYEYAGHGNAVLCARCGSTFDAVLEATPNAAHT